MRVLAFAYACEPAEGSEPGAGWAFARMLASRADVWVVTRANNREAIEAGLENVPERDRLHFVYVDLPAWARFWKRGRIGIQPYYLLWQALALRQARRLHRRRAFDLTFHVTLANAWLGSLAGLVGPPFVYGPVGGTLGMPWRMAPAVGTTGTVYETVRFIAVSVSRYVNPIARSAWRRARVILVQSPETIGWLPRGYRAKAHVFPNVAFDDGPRGWSGRIPEARTALFAGNLLPLKGVALAIDALSYLPGWTLELCGDGRDAARLRRRATRRGVRERVRFRGRLSRDDLVDRLRVADVFAFPSLRDSAGWAVAEASAVGVPVVCLDRGGPPTIVGRGVPVTTPGATARELARQISAASGTSGGAAFALDVEARGRVLWDLVHSALRTDARTAGVPDRPVHTGLPTAPPDRP